MRLAEPREDPRQRLGRDGETAAATYLAEAGLRVLERRVRTRGGEIDIVAEEGELLIFVEVKARRGVGYGRPAEAVTRAKRNRLGRAALAWLTWRGQLERRCRFDVVEVFADLDTIVEVRHIRDAFRL